VELIEREDTMDQATGQHMSHEPEATGGTASPTSGKAPWQEPKLAFIEPKLTTHGKLEDVTAGFFGGFTP
jgi:hypothetical protein